MVSTFWWVIAMIFISLPLVLSFITVFMMLTYTPREDDYVSDWQWADDVDENAKN